MNASDSPRGAPPDARDWDLRLPELVLYAAPVALALFCLTMSQANNTVFWGFDESEPATPLSTAFMISCMLIALAGARRPDLPRPMRIVGGITALLALVAALDENLLWHETSGRQIRHAADSVPRDLTHYTDDVGVLLGAIVGGVIVFYCIRYVARATKTPYRLLELLPYFACVMAFAIGHGLLDIAGHGSQMVSRIWPELSDAAAHDYVERISYFEEICKLWTEWFVVLLLLKLLHRQRGPLVWSLLAAAGSVMAVVGGLWGIDDLARGIPSLRVGEPMDVLRNFHALFALAWIWTAWVTMRWVCFRRSPERGELTGLLLVVPLAPLLGGLIGADGMGGALRAVAEFFMSDAAYGASVARHGLLLAVLLIPGVACGIATGQLVKRWPMPTGAVIGAGCVAFSTWRSPSLAWIVLIAVAGGLVVLSLLVAGDSRRALVIAVVLALSAVASSAWWAIGALSWAVFVWAAEAPGRQLGRRTATLLTLAAVQLAVLVAVVLGSKPAFIPNHEWQANPGRVFEVIYEPGAVDKTKGQLDGRASR